MRWPVTGSRPQNAGEKGETREVVNLQIGPKWYEQKCMTEQVTTFIEHISSATLFARERHLQSGKPSIEQSTVIRAALGGLLSASVQEARWVRDR